MKLTQHQHNAALMPAHVSAQLQLISAQIPAPLPQERKAGHQAGQDTQYDSSTQHHTLGHGADQVRVGRVECVSDGCNLKGPGY